MTSVFYFGHIIFSDGRVISMNGAQMKWQRVVRKDGSLDSRLRLGKERFPVFKSELIPKLFGN